MIQAMSYVYFVSTLSTMEKRFKIQSKTTGRPCSHCPATLAFIHRIVSKVPTNVISHRTSIHPVDGLHVHAIPFHTENFHPTDGRVFY